jgi:rubrerythrin
MSWGRRKKEMDKVTKLILCTAVFLIAGLLIAAANPALAGDTARSNKTLQHLQAAYNGESNAHTRYLAFAKKADEEGYGEVASLFRAAARAEEIHFTNHAAVIRKMGAEPQAKILTPVVKSTRENLENSASTGEAYERDSMYPRFIARAHRDRNDDAVRTFEFARAAEAQHFKLFDAAAKNLENMRGKSRNYFVCEICGFTAESREAEMCPNCPKHEQKYIIVS